MGTTVERLAEVLLAADAVAGCYCRDMPHDVNPPCGSRRNANRLAGKILKALKDEGWVAPPEPFTPPKGFIVETTEELDRIAVGYLVFDADSDVMVRNEDGWQKQGFPIRSWVVLPAVVVRTPDE